MQKYLQFYCFTVLGSTSIVIHSVKQRLLRNRPGSDAATSRDFLRERLQRAFTRANQLHWTAQQTTCTGFPCLTESSTRQLMSVTMWSRVLHLHILLIFSCTFLSGLSVYPLIHLSFAESDFGLWLFKIVTKSILCVCVRVVSVHLWFALT